MQFEKSDIDAKNIEEEPSQGNTQDKKKTLGRKDFCLSVYAIVIGLAVLMCFFAPIIQCTKVYSRYGSSHTEIIYTGWQVLSVPDLSAIGYEEYASSCAACAIVSLVFTVLAILLAIVCLICIRAKLNRWLTLSSMLLSLLGAILLFCSGNELDKKFNNYLLHFQTR